MCRIGSGNCLRAVIRDARYYTVGSNPFAAASGDFNRDGKHDLAVANNRTNNISVLLDNGDGTFGAKTDYDVGQPAYGVVATDLNGDSKLPRLKPGENERVESPCCHQTCTPLTSTPIIQLSCGALV
jgi:hypothetical protein